MEYRLAVFIGRFQPFHKGHEQMIQYGLSIADKVLVLVGSAGAAPSPKNPWSFEQRRVMIWSSFEMNQRVEIRPLRDYYYSHDSWIADVQAKVSEFTKAGDTVALIGTYKDGSSYYLNSFPQWEFQTAPTVAINATDLRESLFEAVTTPLRDWERKVVLDATHHDAVAKATVPNAVKDFLSEWQKTSAYGDLASEYHYVKDYKAQWANSPYPPTFVTTDAVVTCSGHVLVIKRKINPGKGLYALPGGFLRPSEHILDGMIRELREETAIRVDKLILRSSIVGSKVFDHPDRSLRGRTISHGYHIKLRDGELPEISANDDAAEVLWMPLWDVIANERNFFEDHAHIVHYFVSAGS